MYKRQVGNLKKSPKKKPKIYFSRRSNQQRVSRKAGGADSKGRACHAEKVGEEAEIQHGKPVPGGTAMPPLPRCSPTLNRFFFGFLGG